MRFVLIIVLCISAIPLQQCSDKTQASLITPPFSGIDIGMSDYEIDAEEGGVISLTNGGTIEIPANAFVDKSGNPVEGKVDVKYREFHDVADIIMSGIPMVYDSAGVKINFESAGMFEIDGFANNEKVFIRNGKSLKVNMASFKAGNDFDFYYLDAEKENWQYEGISEAQPNVAKEKKLIQLTEPGSKPVEPRKLNSSAILIDLNVNYNNFPELKPFHGIMWQYAGLDNETNPKDNDWIFSEKWNDMYLTQNENEDAYTLNLISENKDFTTKVVPALSGKDYKKAMADFEKRTKRYNDLLAQKEQEEARLKQEADLIRTFKVNNFGFYNWDRCYRQQAPLAVRPKFRFKNTDTDINDVKIFHIANKNAVVQYSPNSTNFVFSRAEDNELIAILPGNKIAKFTKDDFKNLDIEELTATNNAECTFEMKPLKGVINSPQDFKKIVL